eukprot:2476045-Heterocapsa_arctica.AAC.1
MEDKEGSLQVLAAVFGRLEGEKHPTVGLDGCLHPGANQWAKIFENDLLKLSEIEVGRELLLEVAKKKEG